jgi:hypothetical protein
MSDLVVLLPLIGYAVALVVFYWVIRLAVRHAIRDADERRSGTSL